MVLHVRIILLLSTFICIPPPHVNVHLVHSGSPTNKEINTLVCTTTEAISVNISLTFLSFEKGRNVCSNHLSCGEWRKNDTRDKYMSLLSAGKGKKTDTTWDRSNFNQEPNKPLTWTSHCIAGSCYGCVVCTSDLRSSATWLGALGPTGLTWIMKRDVHNEICLREFGKINFTADMIPMNL